MLFKKLPFVQQPSFTYDEIQPKISPVDWSVFTAIIRLIVGWNKKEDFISTSLLENKTGLSENTIRASLKRLQSYRMLEISLILKMGVRHQFIKINENKEQYILPIKQKLSNKVNNFFKKSDVKKETFTNNKVIVNNTLPQELRVSEKLLDTSNVKVLHPQTLSLDTSNVEDTIYINKENINTHNTYTCNEDDNVVFEVDQILKEELVGYGLYPKYATSLIKDFSSPFIWRVIAYIKEEKSNGRKINSVGAMISYLIKNPKEMEKVFATKESSYADEQQTEASETYIENEVKENAIPGSAIKPFSDFKFKTLQGLLRKHGTPVTDNDYLTLANNLVRSQNKAFILDLKAMFKMEDLTEFLAEIRSNQFFAKFGNLNNKEIMAFWEIFDNPDLIQEEAKSIAEHVQELKKTVMGLSGKALNSVRNAQRNLGIIGAFDEPIPL